MLHKLRDYEDEKTNHKKPPRPDPGSEPLCVSQTVDKEHHRSSEVAHLLTISGYEIGEGGLQALS